MAKSSIYTALTAAETLYQILHGWHVDGGPGQPGPIVSREFGLVMAAGIIRELAGNIHDARLGAGTRRLGADLLQRATGELVNGYNGDGPPWLDFPWPLPWPPKKFNPRDSLFDGITPAVMDQLLSGLAKRLAETAAQGPVATRGS